MNEELTLAVDELRSRPRDRIWFIPAVFPGGEVPDLSIGAGKTLRDLNYILLSQDTWSANIARIINAILLTSLRAGRARRRKRVLPPLTREKVTT